MKSLNPSFDQIVEEALELRRRAESSEADFFIFLVKIEEEWMGVLEANGFATFDNFLLSYNLTDKRRYIFFRDGLQVCGADKARSYGVHWVTAVGEQRGAHLALLEDRVETFWRIHKVAPSERTVRDWVKEIPREGGAGATAKKRLTELLQLREENRVLKIELKAAQEENAKLRSELEAARARILSLSKSSLGPDDQTPTPPARARGRHPKPGSRSRSEDSP